MENRRSHLDKDSNISHMKQNLVINKHHTIMKMNLLKGMFSSDELLDLLTQFVHVKIKYHEGKIKSDSSEESVKMRERRIISLQNDLFQLRKVLQNNTNPISVDSELAISFVNSNGN